MCKEKKIGTSFWEGFFRICSLLGALTFIYTAIQAIQLRPSIEFDVLAQEVLAQDGQHIEKQFIGTFKNKSLAPNSIVKFTVSVFEIATRERVYDGNLYHKIFRETSSGSYEIILPINLGSKESIPIAVITYIPLDGELKKLLDQSKPRLTEYGSVDEKYAFMLLIEDVNGNIFNVKGNRMPQQCLDQKWIGASFGSLAYCNIKYDFGNFLSTFGLTNF